MTNFRRLKSKKETKIEIVEDDWNYDSPHAVRQSRSQTLYPKRVNCTRELADAS